MKFAIVLLSFLSNLASADILCTDAVLRQVQLSTSSTKVKLNGFDFVGTPSGSVFDCRGADLDCQDWLTPKAQLCQSEPIGRGNILLQVTSTLGVKTAVLYNSFGFPYFIGVCR